MSLVSTSGQIGVMLYLDPGTGGLLFSTIAGLATTSFFVAKGLFYQFRARLGSRPGSRPPAGIFDEYRLVLYSEGSQYASTFAPLIGGLIDAGVPFAYLSSDSGDPLLNLSNDLVETEFIGRGHVAWGRLNTLHAAVCAMTTPGLDVLQIKRSPHVGHYVHIVHAPGDMAFNKTYSFDRFDSVLICGRHQERTVRALEKLRGTAAKELFPVGCVYYDTLLQRSRPQYPARLAETSRCALLAPTWGRNGLLSRYGMTVIQSILDAGFSLIIRPHPQSKVSEESKVRELKRLTQGMQDCCWDETGDPMEAMNKADVLISDISGIIFDFAFLTERPIVTLKIPIEKQGLDASDLPYEPWETVVIETISRRVDIGEMDRLADIVQSEAVNSGRADKIRELRTEFVLNFGEAAVPAAQVLRQLLLRNNTPRNDG